MLEVVFLDHTGADFGPKALATTLPVLDAVRPRSLRAETSVADPLRVAGHFHIAIAVLSHTTPVCSVGNKATEPGIVL